MKVFTKIALVAALFTVSYTANAQFTGPGTCTGQVGIRNFSDDAWRIDYYGNIIVVQPGDQTVLGFVNADQNLGRGVILEAPGGGIASPFCGYKFQTNPDFWNAPCAPGTTSVTYMGNMNAAGCFDEARIFIQ